MFLQQPGLLQSWKYKFTTSANFCVWILSMDGLHSPPFDRHIEQRGPLQERGLNRENWTRWFQDVIEQYPQNPIQAWSAVEPLTEFLEEQWQIYLKQKTLEEHYNAFLKACIRKLHRELEPYYPYLPSLTITLVNYVESVQTSLSPISVIIGIPDNALSDEMLRTSLLQSLDQLGASAGMTVNAKEAYTSYVKELQQTIHKEIDALPVEMRSRTVSSLPPVDQLPVTVLEWLTPRLKVFHMLSKEHEIQGTIEHLQITGNQHYAVIAVRDSLLTITEQEIQGEPHQKVSPGQKVAIRLSQPIADTIRFSYALERA